jgi:hypothetical protein
MHLIKKILPLPVPGVLKKQDWKISSWNTIKAFLAFALDKQLVKSMEEHYPI